MEKKPLDLEWTENGNVVNPNKVPFWTSARLGLALLGFFGFTFVYALRVNLFVAIVCMVNHTAISSSNSHGPTPSPSLANLSHTTSIGAVEEEGGGGGTGRRGGGGGVEGCGLIRGIGSGGSGNVSGSSGSLWMEGTLDWDKKTQGLVLGSFFWGYLASQIPAGWLAGRVGGKWCYGAAMLVASLITLLTPIVATHSFQGLVVLRILLGAASGVTFPAMHCLWGSWAPPLERTKLMAFSYAGVHVGNVVTFPLAGFLCKYGFAGGWPSIFYILGVLSLGWLALWVIFCSNSPAQHRRISDIEKRYIDATVHGATDPDSHKPKKVPWKDIATSMPNYAIIVSNITSDWGLYTLLTNIPTYLREVLHFDIASNGLVSALPFVGIWLTMNLSGWVADLLRRRLLSTGATRKLMDVFGKVTAGALLVALGHLDCHRSLLAVGLLVLAVSLSGFQYGGFLVNHVDIAPRYAGLLFGISNSVAAVTGFLSPVVVGVVTEERQTRAEWQIVFYLAAAVYLFGAVFYAIFASGDLEPWASKDGEVHVALEKQNIAFTPGVLKMNGEHEAGGKLLVNGDVGEGGKLILNGDMGEGGKLLLNGDVGEGGKLLLNGDMGEGGKLLLNGDVGEGGNLLVNGDMGEGGKLLLNGDVGEGGKHIMNGI
ncbi:sialin-like [Babylonia areolata]|uniref:sialin-like n=1 Tax=Babylonia areolata TaxID=304850 RepID=UPI003FD27745